MVDALGSPEILEPVLAEVGEVGFDQRRRRSGDEDLAAVARRRDPSRAVDVLADIALVSEERRARVDSGPDTNPPAHCQSFGEVRGRSHGTGRCREREEERVPLRVDLDATLVGAGVAYHRAVVGERVRVPLGAELAQQRGRSFNVGEDEGDSAGR